MKNDDLKYWLAINRVGKIGAARFKRLFSYFPDMKTVWNEATLIDLLDAGLEEKIAEDFITKKKTIDPDRELELMEKNKIQAITIIEESYPKLLKEIYLPPPILYFRGSLTDDLNLSVAVVGTRKISDYGRYLTNEIVSGLAKNKITVTSGLALGVDATAHLCALQNKTKTIAVLGSGLDDTNIYPTSNRYLAKQIIDNGGLLISEYPIGTLPLKQNFPARNRIISGLSLGVVVIEAGENSGALITAAYALEQNREVFAVPGNITSPNSAGTNKLIKDGARVVTSVTDILETLQIRQLVNFQKNTKILPDSPEESLILKFLTKEPLHIDCLAQATKLPTNVLNATLTMMELKGKVKNLGNMNYIIKN